MKRIGPRFGSGFAAVLSAVLVLGSSHLGAQEPPPIDPNKMSDLGNKVFDTKTIDFDKQSDLVKTAPGFDKMFKMTGAGSDMINKTANLGGRQIYAPAVDFNKTFPTGESPLFKTTSPFSEKVSSLTADKTAPFSTETKAPGLDRVLPDKSYQGREASLVREAMDRLDQSSQEALAQQMKANASDPAAKNPSQNKGPSPVAPIISIEDVKLLIDKDVAPASEMPQAQAAGAAAAKATP